MQDNAASNDISFDTLLRDTFLEEAVFLIDELESGMLGLDQEGSDKAALLSQIFRAAHSIKGSARSVGFKEIADFSHLAEDCLAILRTRPELVSHDATSILLKAVDALKWRLLILKNDPEAAKSEWNVTEIAVELKELAHRLEPQINAKKEEVPAVSEKRQEQPAPIETRESSTNTVKKTGVAIKIDSDRVESILNLAGELVGLKSQLMRNEAIRELADPHVGAMLSELDKSIRELYEKTLAVRMTSLKPLFQKMHRTARDLSAQLAKPVDVILQGEETELDRAIIDQIGDPLTHLIRNSIDHGIENVDARQVTGKPEKGTVTLNAYNRSGNVYIEISDDGAGINTRAVAQKAKDKGLIGPHVDLTSLSDREVYNFLFLPGFSTAKQITDVSGRGVGLDVVRSNIESLRGSVEIESTPGKGTTFRIVLPLTAAITDGIVVESCKQKYVMPIANVTEFASFTPEMVTKVNSESETLLYRGEILGLFRLPKLLSVAPSEKKNQIAVITKFDHQRVAIAVDEVLGQSQVVLKSVDSGFASLPDTVAGAAVLEDGKVGLVLDVFGLLNAQQAKPSGRVA